VHTEIVSSLVFAVEKVMADYRIHLSAFRLIQNKTSAQRQFITHHSSLIAHHSSFITHHCAKQTFIPDQQMHHLRRMDV